MKNIIYSVFACLLLVACNPIPNKTVFEELTTDELASAIKAEPGFADEYEAIRGLIELSNFSEVQKAQFKDVTYRHLYDFICHADDSAYWAPLEEKWGQEWDNTLAKDLEKVDETMEYWEDYKAKNSLSRFAKVELSSFYITHYEYIGGVDDAYICFNITPIDGTIEQIKFTYSYNYKINKGQRKQTHKCIYSSPISRTTEGAWELDYDEKDAFDGMTVSKFFQKYDLDIEITDIRKDGVNYSIEDLNIPAPVIAAWENPNPETWDAVATLVNPSYVNRDTYIENKKDEKLKEYDSLCFEFGVALRENNILNDLQSIFE